METFSTGPPLPPSIVWVGFVAGEVSEIVGVSALEKPGAVDPPVIVVGNWTETDEIVLVMEEVEDEGVVEAVELVVDKVVEVEDDDEDEDEVVVDVVVVVVVFCTEDTEIEVEVLVEVAIWVVEDLVVVVGRGEIVLPSLRNNVSITKL